jgi:hypothetical protein
VKPEIYVGASQGHHTLTALPYKIAIRRKDSKSYPPKYTPFEPCCPLFWYLAMRIGAPFWHWVERSTNGGFGASCAIGCEPRPTIDAMPQLVT